MTRASGRCRRTRRSLRAGLPCEPCWTRAPLLACAGRVDCLARLSVDAIEHQVRAVLMAAGRNGGCDVYFSTTPAPAANNEARGAPGCVVVAGTRLSLYQRKSNPKPT